MTPAKSFGIEEYFYLSDIVDVFRVANGYILSSDLLQLIYCLCMRGMC